MIAFEYFSQIDRHTNVNYDLAIWFLTNISLQFLLWNCIREYHVLIYNVFVQNNCKLKLVSIVIIPVYQSILNEIVISACKCLYLWNIFEYELHIERKYSLSVLNLKCHINCHENEITVNTVQAVMKEIFKTMRKRQLSSQHLLSLRFFWLLHLSNFWWHQLHLISRCIIWLK